MKLTKSLWTKLITIGLGATMALGVGLTASKIATDEVNAADVTNNVAVTAFGGTSGTSYVATAVSSTTYDVNLTANNFIPKSGQVRGNQSGASANFYMFNTTAKAGYYLESITMSRGANTGTFTTTASRTGCAFGSSAYSAPSAFGGQAADTIASGLTSVTWTVANAQTNNYGYFQINHVQTSGTVGTVTVTITWGQAVTGNTVTYQAGTGGSGSYNHTSQPSGNYTLLAFGSLTGVSANSGYAFSDYTVGGVSKNPGDVVSISANTTITVNFQSIPTYTVTYQAGTGGSGSYNHTSQPSGNYTLLAFGSLTGVSANSGYAFSDYTVGGVSKNPGDVVSISGATTITVNLIAVYTVTYSAGTNGSGTPYAHTGQLAGSYTLLAFSTTGLSADSGYVFKNYTVGGSTKNPGDTITISGATAVAVNFEETPFYSATLFYPGGTTVSNSDATKVLSSSLSLTGTPFSAVATKNGPTNNVGLNTDGTTRLYGNKTDGNGNLLTVSLTSTDYKIVSLDITFGASTNSATVLIEADSSQLYSGVAPVENTIQSYSLLGATLSSADSFTIKNTHTTSGSVGQVWIKSIEILYATPAQEAALFANEVMTGSGENAKGNCASVLSGLNNIYALMSSDAQTYYTNSSGELFANSKERMAYLTAWVAANPSGTTSLSTPLENHKTALIAIVIIGLIGLSTVAGFYFLKKKKETL